MHINKNTFCIHPFASINTAPNANYAPCCMSERAILQDSGEPYKTGEHTMQEVFDSKWMDNLRASLANGIKHVNCVRCWNEEKTGRDSKRIRDSREYLTSARQVDKTLTIRMLDLKLGNLCNLKCRICNPWSSSNWIEEWHSVRASTEPKTEFVKSFAVMRKTWNPDQPIWDSVEKVLPNLEHMNITGGEPLMIENMWNMLQQSVDGGYAPNQSLQYNTNGSVIPTVAQWELWSHFKEVDVQFSVDDINDRHHYQRHPSEWKNVKATIEEFKKRSFIKLSTNATVSNFNIYYLDEVTDEIMNNIGTSIWYNILHGPSELSVAALSPEIKEILIKKLSNVIEYNPDIEPVLGLIASAPDPEKIKLFLQRAAEHDAYRNESFEQTFPEWYAILKQHYL